MKLTLKEIDVISYSGYLPAVIILISMQKK